jgi:hypothetical protein
VVFSRSKQEAVDINENGLAMLEYESGYNHLAFQNVESGKQRESAMAHVRGSTAGDHHTSRGDGAHRPRFAPLARMSAWASLASGDSRLEFRVSFGHYDPTKTTLPVILKGDCCGRGMLGSPAKL